MYISNTTKKVTHKIVMSGEEIKKMMLPKQRNNEYKGDPFFGKDVRGENTDLLNTPDVGVYFLSTVRDDSNIINIIYPNGLIHPVDYNLTKMRAFRGPTFFKNSLEELANKQIEEGLYVIYNHKLFNRTEIDKINRISYFEYFDYYSNLSYFINPYVKEKSKRNSELYI